MIDLSLIEGFDWDEGNARKSEERHGVTRVEAEQVFSSDPLLLLMDEEHSNVEERYHALGRTNQGRKLFVSFTLRAGGQVIRVISARDMSRKERARYDEEA